MAFRSLSRMAALSASKRPCSPNEGSKSKRPSGHWSQGLLASMNDPELQIEEDEKVVVIKDKYPKARHHFLVLPKEKIPNLKSVKKEHLDLLRHMHKKGEEIADRASKELLFRFGYHAVPSMSHLHLHVISQDFVSDCLKNKKHWNSFTTAYFIDSKDIIDQLEESESIHITATADLLKEDLRCHVCKKHFTTIPALKAHIALHNVTKSSKTKKS